MMAFLLLPVTALALLGYRTVVAEIRMQSNIHTAQLKAVGKLDRLLSRAGSNRRQFLRSGNLEALKRTRAALEEAVRRSKEALSISDVSRRQFSRTGQILVHYLAELDQAARLLEHLPAAKADRGALLDRMAELEDILRQPEGSAGSGAAEDLEATIEKMNRLEKELLPGGRLGREILAREHLLESLSSGAEDVLNEIAQRAWTDLESDGETAFRRSQRALRNLLTALLLTLVALAALLVWLPGRLVAPLSRLRMLVRSIGHGEEDLLEPAAFPNDETRRLAEALARLLAGRVETEKLQKSRIRLLEQRFRALMRTLNQPVLVLDRDRNVVLASRSIENLMGVSAGAAAQQPVERLFDAEALQVLFHRLRSGSEEQAEDTVSVKQAGGPAGRVRLTVKVIRDE